MGFWSTIAHRLKEILQRMIGSRTIEQTLHVSPVISSQMENAIELWSDMYKGEAPWLHEPSTADPTRVVSLGLPALIASEKARTALIEFTSEITTPTEEVEQPNPEFVPPAEGELQLPTEQVPETITEEVPVSDTQRAEYLEEQYKKLKKQLRKQIEYGIAKGGLVIKPYVIQKDTKTEGAENANETVETSTQSPDSASPVKPTTADIEFDFIQADAFYPLAFNAAGDITEAAFIQTKADKDTVYRRLEYHKWENNTVTVVNKAYKSTNNSVQGNINGMDLGKEVPLTDIPEWKDIQAETKIANVEQPLFAYFKMPEANTIDTVSPLGVSGYSRAVPLIKDADMQYSRLLWEYEAGEMAIDVDRDAFMWKTGTAADGGDTDRGYSYLGHSQQRLFRQVDISENETFQYYAPTLRDMNYITGLNTILMRIEDVTGLSRGTISDASAEARTATELKILKQRSYQTNADIQQAIESCLKEVVYIMNAYCDLYDIVPAGEYDISFEWDDSIIVDIDTELSKRITLMHNGLASKVETRMWYFGETERQAREALQEIEQESLQSAQDNIMMQKVMGQMFEGEEGNVNAE